MHSKRRGRASARPIAVAVAVDVPIAYDPVAAARARTRGALAIVLAIRVLPWRRDAAQFAHGVQARLTRVIDFLHGRDARELAAEATLGILTGWWWGAVL